MNTVKYDLDPEFLLIVINETDDGYDIVRYNLKPSLFATLPPEKQICVMKNTGGEYDSVKFADVYSDDQGVIYLSGDVALMANMSDDIWELNE